MTALKILIFTVGVVAFYAYVGQMVPQKETHPPENTEIRADMTTDEMVEVGKEIAGGKGTCLTCHTIGSQEAGRFPDLAGIGDKASTRKAGMSALDYLAESIYDPNAHVTEGFLPGMPPIHKPPIGLSDGEILTVVAYLQSLGSTPTVTMETRLLGAGQEADAASDVAPAATTSPGEADAAKALLTSYMCITCHKLDGPEKLVGPSLHDAGARLNRAALYESILDPDATVATGFPPGVMTVTLKGMGFYDKVSVDELKLMVSFLASLKGE